MSEKETVTISEYLREKHDEIESLRAELREREAVWSGARLQKTISELKEKLRKSEAEFRILHDSMEAWRLRYKESNAARARLVRGLKDAKGSIEIGLCKDLNHAGTRQSIVFAIKQIKKALKDAEETE